MKKYFEILNEIEDNNIDMTKLYILSCVEQDENTIKKLDYIYDTWLEIDEDICLARLCDIVDMHWEEIQDDEYGYDDIIIDLFN